MDKSMVKAIEHISKGRPYNIVRMVGSRVDVTTVITLI